jgi:hypothetical protein
MINKLIKIYNNKNVLDQKFLNSLFLKRINYIINNIDSSFKLSFFNINKKNIILIYEKKLLNSTFEKLEINIPISFYYSKYNSILEYLKINLEEVYSKQLILMIKNFGCLKKYQIKDIQRKIQSLFKKHGIKDFSKSLKINENDFNYILSLKEELKMLQNEKAF